MTSRQIMYGLLLAVGFSIFVLLMIPAVHVPCIVVHGPTTALRAQRAAWLLTFLMRAAALLFVGMLTLLLPRSVFQVGTVTILNPDALSLSCALRC
jgi:hypothetical protein